MIVPDEIFLARVLRQFESGRRFPSLRREVSSQRNGVWNLRSTTLFGTPLCRTRFFLQSKCGACGFTVLVRSLEELIEHEKLHRTQCSPSNALIKRAMRAVVLNRRM